MLSFRYREEQSMELGAFSISLAVKDIEASRRFYEKFGFKVFSPSTPAGTATPRSSPLSLISASCSAS